MNNYYNPYQTNYYQREYREFSPFQNENLENPKDGFEKGNLFSNLYDSYKNYQPMKLKPKTEEERLLYNLLAISFATHELNLYLDLHPDNQSMLMLFNDYKKQKEKLTKEYEEKYGPLTVCTTSSNDSIFEWEKKDWPWEGYNV